MMLLLTNLVGEESKMETRCEIARAKAPLNEAMDRLRDSGNSEIAEILKRLFNMSLLHFVEGRKKNPIHHMAYVVKFMSEIMLGEGASEEELKLGTVAALLHDIGLGRVEEGKVRKADIESAPPGKRSGVIDEAIKSRQAHMLQGAETARELLSAYNVWFGEAFSDGDIQKIIYLIEIHDGPSIAEYDLLRGLPEDGTKLSAAKWLFEKDDKLMMYLREADRLWMLSEDGIDLDLERELEKKQKQLSEEGKDPASATVDSRIRVIKSIKRHREEAELYSRILGKESAKEYGFKDGFLYRTDTGREICRRLVSSLKENYLSKKVSVAVSLGGTKVTVGLVYQDGRVIPLKESVKWRSAFGLSHERKEDADPLLQGIVGLINEALEYVPVEQVVKIGLSTKGPLEYDKMEERLKLGYRKKITTLPFENYPIEEKMCEFLEQSKRWSTRLSNIDIRVLHDGAAAILGEVSCVGTFPREKNATAVLAGTGVGVGIVENGRSYEGNDQTCKERVFGSLGRHLIYIPDESPFGYHYKYRGIEQEKTKASICKSAGETYLSERIAGPWLAQRIAGKLAVQGSYLTRENMGLDYVDREKLKLFSKRKNLDECKVLEQSILEGLTKAAQKQEQWALGQMAEIGFEIGRALAQFILEFRSRDFTKKIVLGATVLERLGLDVPGNSTDDLLLERIYEGIEESCDRTEIEVKRSKNNLRELVAFIP